MKTRLALACALAAAVLSSGCATISGSGTSQSVSIKTLDPTGADLAGVNCELTNDIGKWFLTTPGQADVHRSNKDLQVLCRKEGFDSATASVVSWTKGNMFGNILLGGGIGAIVDHNNGSAYEYPSFLQLSMGQHDVRITAPATATAGGKTPDAKAAGKTTSTN